MDLLFKGKENGQRFSLTNFFSEEQDKKWLTTCHQTYVDYHIFIFVCKTILKYCPSDSWVYMQLIHTRFLDWMSMGTICRRTRSRSWIKVRRFLRKRKKNRTLVTLGNWPCLICENGLGINYMWFHNVSNGHTQWNCRQTRREYKFYMW